MQTISEIRIRNLLLIKQQHKTFAALQKVIGISAPQFSQMASFLKNPESKTARGMGERLARRIETELGLPRGWMDTPQGEPNLVPPTVKTPEDGLSAIQSAVIDTVTRLMKARLLSDTD